MKDLTELELQLMDIDDRIRPMATRPVDTNDPNWMKKLQEAPALVDQAGVRSSAEQLIENLIDEYQNGDEDVRRHIRSWMTTYSSFECAASLPYPPTSDEQFRRHLFWFSIRDQGRDSRDAILDLESLCAAARSANVDVTSLLLQIAELSSDENKYGMGSTRTMLKRA